jgi:signal transduction histidine kinase
MLVQLPDEPLSLVADPDRLTQVLSNLLINSATYTPPGGHVELRVRRVDDALEMTVTDNGVTTVPELNYSAADTLARYQDGVRFTEGIGIGLALVKDLVELHGGAVVSVPADAGVSGTVGVRLPIGSEPEESRISAEAGARP